MDDERGEIRGQEEGKDEEEGRKGRGLNERVKDSHTLHVGRVQGLVVLLEVDPSTHSLNGLLPLSRVSHDLSDPSTNEKNERNETRSASAFSFPFLPLSSRPSLPTTSKKGREV